MQIRIYSFLCTPPPVTLVTFQSPEQNEDMKKLLRGLLSGFVLGIFLALALHISPAGHAAWPSPDPTRFQAQETL